MKFHNFIGLPNKYEEWRRNIGLIFKTSTETSFRSKTFIKAYLATYLLICNITKIYCIFLKVMLTNIMLVATSSIHEYNVCKMVLLQKSPLLFCIKNGLHKMAASLVYFLITFVFWKESYQAQWWGYFVHQVASTKSVHRYFW